MSKAMVIHPTGMVEVVDFPEKDKLDWYYKKLDCSCIDIVKPYGLEEIADTYNLKSLLGRFCLVCDDEGLLKTEPEINMIASLLYGYGTHGQILCGKVLLAADNYTDDGIETVGLTDAEVMMAHVSISSMIEAHNERVEKRERG